MQRLSERTLRRIKALLQAEGGRSTPSAQPLATGQQVAYVTITDVEEGDGYFPGKAILYDAANETWDEFGDVWAFAVNGALESGGEYLGLRFGDWEITGDTRPVFACVGQFVESGDLIDISGRTGSVADVTAAQFLRTAVSGTSGATVVTPDDASPTLPGDVSTGTQTFAGLKDFQDDITLSNQVKLAGDSLALTISTLGGDPADIAVFSRSGSSTDGGGVITIPSNDSGGVPESGILNIPYQAETLSGAVLTYTYLGFAPQGGDVGDPGAYILGGGGIAGVGIVVNGSSANDSTGFEMIPDTLGDTFWFNPFTAYNQTDPAFAVGTSPGHRGITDTGLTSVDVRGGIVVGGSSGGSYTDEEAQDAVGSIFVDSARIDFTYDDGTPSITADLITDTITADYLHATATDMLFGRSTAGAGAGEQIACTAAGRALLDDANAAAQRTTLGLGTAAVQNTGTSGANVPLLNGVNSWSSDQEFLNSAIFEHDGIFIWDTDKSAQLQLHFTSNLTTARVLTIATGDANRSVSFSGNLVISADATISGTHSGTSSGTNTGDEVAADDTTAGVIEIATQAEQETGTDTTRAVTPGRQHLHPTAAKAWVNIDGSGAAAIRASHNVSSVTDNGPGDYTINFTTAFSSADYGFAIAGGRGASGAGGFLAFASPANPTASAFRITCTDSSFGATDTEYVGACFFGDQ